MIKRLRIKFVCVIMAIVMVLLGIILGIVLHFTASSMEKQSISMMRTVASGPRQHDPVGKPSAQVRLPFFTVELSADGELIAASSEFFDLSDKEYVQRIVTTALAENRETGELKQYHLRYLIEPSPVGVTMVFSDTNTEDTTLQTLFISSFLIFFVAMGTFLGISILLSHWVIKPVAVAWDQQRQFVADASHELKTPLSVIMANAELLQGEEVPENERRQFSGSILSMTYQMRSLVENMLEMARVDSGSGKQPFFAVDFSQIVNDAVLSVQLLYEEAGLALESSTAENVFVHGNERQLYQVLDVLLDNALKYSSPCGTVRAVLTQTGRSCLLTVSSPGETISQEDLTNIFKRFYRADKARAMNGSYGLGLSIAEGVVTAHKGKIWAQSRDGINTFFVQLPICPNTK